MKYNYSFLITTAASLLLGLLSIQAQNSDSIFIDKLYSQSLENGKSYEYLRDLCKTVGGRLSGSENADKAVSYSQKKMIEYGFEKVYLQPALVPHWERGAAEKVSFRTNPKSVDQPIPACALGGSVPTNGLIQAELIELRDFSELEELGPDAIKGKIVFFNRPMQASIIATFRAYGGAVNQRVEGAWQAARYGAVAVIVRSMTTSLDDYPHTGVMIYRDSVKKIPAAAISTNGAELLSAELKKNPHLKLSMQLNCSNHPDKLSNNVIGEWEGSEKPEQIIVVGGHLDSWDLGEGAHDDGAGCSHAIEALRLLKSCGYKPRHSLRVCLFMNEENGTRGAKAYADSALQKGERHYAAIESDAGGFTPKGFSIDAPDSVIQRVQEWKSLFEPYEVFIFSKGGGGADIAPLKEQATPLFGFRPDSQRYFDFHHTAQDIFENVNKRELELGAATIAALIYLIDKYGFE